MRTADDGAPAGGIDEPVAPPEPARPSVRDRASQRFTAWLLAIAGAGLAWRVAFTTVARRHQALGTTTDNNWYFTAGKMIAEGWGFGNPFVWGGQHKYIPSAGHPPLYPVFLGVTSWLGANTVFEARIAGCLLGTVTVVVLGLTARELLGNRAGLIAAVLAAAYPNLWINDATILSETLYVLMASLFLWSAIRYWRRPSFGRIALVSLWVGLAALTRSEAVLFYPLAVLPLVLLRRDMPWPDRWRRLGVAVVVACAVIGPWVVYNNLGRFEHRVFIVSGSGVAMTYGNCDQTYSGDYLGYWYWTCGVTHFPKKQDESLLDANARKQALHYIRTHLKDQPKVVAARVGRLFHVYRPRQSIFLDTFFERRGRWPSRVALAMYYPITILACFGAYVLWRRGMPLSPYVAIFVSAVIAAATTFGVTRYRAAFDAAAVVLAGVAVSAGIDVWQRHASGRRALAEDRA